MPLDSLEDLFVDELKDVYNAESQILKALPKMAKAASSPDLQNAFREHLEVTKGHVDRLEKIFGDLDMKPRGKKCVGMEGIIEEGKEMMGEEAEKSVKDAALISSAQRVEHYEMAAYGTLRTYAETLGYDDAAQMLQQTLDEEEQTDRKLTDLAEGLINVRAAQGESDDLDADDEFEYELEEEEAEE